MPNETELVELAASALRKAIRHQHAGCGPYSEWELVLHQPAASYDPRDPKGPALRGLVRITITVPKIWQDKSRRVADRGESAASATQREEETSQ